MRATVTICLMLIFCVVLSVNTLAQNRIEGQLADSVSEQPLQYGVVTVLNVETGKLVEGGITDTLGRFSIGSLKDGNYHVDVEMIGYKKSGIQNISLSKSITLDLGKIKLSAGINTLDEVIITGEPSAVATRLDKQIYKADKFEAAKGGTAVDVLKNMPSVSVDAEGSARLRGSTGILVLINGKPTASDVGTILGQIPANSIENVEIITSPGARFDADGRNGIINITLKKGTTDGVTFLVNTQTGLPSIDHYGNKEKPWRYGLDGSLTYKKDKVELTLGGSYQQNDLAGYRDGDVNTTLNNVYTSLPSKGERSFKRRTYAARGLLNLSLNKTNSISFGAYAGERRQFRLADINYVITRRNLNTTISDPPDSYYNSNLVKKQGNFSLLSIDYTHNFENKSSLAFSTLYEYANLNSFTRNINTPPANISDTLDYTRNLGDSPIHGWRGKVDYSTTLGKGKLEAGYQLRRQSQSGRYTYETAVPGTPQFILNPEFSADVDIENIIHGVYTQYTGKIDKLEYTAGLRYEHALRTFEADRLPETYRLTLSNFFPTANLLYTLLPGLRLKGGFSRRVQRSTNNELNPYPEREHTETLEQGDPRILPEFVSLAELGIVKDFDKNSVFVTVYNQYIQNVVNRVNSVYNDTILNRIFTNAGRGTSIGIESGLNISPTKFWSSYAGANVYNYHLRGKLFNNDVRVNNSGIIYSFNTTQTFVPAVNWSVQLLVNYLSTRPTAQGNDSRFLSPNLSVKKTFAGGRFSTTLLWQNIGLGFLPSNEQRITTSGSNFYTTTNYIQEKDVLWVNLSYNFKQGNRKAKLPSSEFGEKEF